MSRQVQAALRILAAVLGIALGWVLQMLVFGSIATGASAHDLRIWALYSAGYCGVGLMLVGLPVALIDPEYVRRRRLPSVLLAGIGGAILAAIPFVFPAPLGFLVAAFAMYVYSVAASLIEEHSGTL